ncbi:MAG: hypothetical protein N3E47_07195 [Candidatus Bathyarchaeota archaeon]|nr:hypothetical protein [Candidatus Bathyarchaeota archaeon]
MGLLEVISRIFESGEYFGALPDGVISVDLITPEIVRVTFIDKVDFNLFCEIAIGEGYSIDAQGYAPRIVDKGNIVARIGGRSDPGAERSVFLYLFPASVEAMSMYMKAVAMRLGVLNSEAGKINIEKLLRYNLKVIGLVEKYRRSRYKSLVETARM